MNIKKPRKGLFFRQVKRETKNLRYEKTFACCCEFWLRSFVLIYPLLFAYCLLYSGIFNRKPVFFATAIQVLLNDGILKLDVFRQDGIILKDQHSVHTLCFALLLVQQQCSKRQHQNGGGQSINQRNTVFKNKYSHFNCKLSTVV